MLNRQVFLNRTRVSGRANSRCCCFPQKRYRAVYDYTAADDDEVSFMDGDEIVDVERIDEGWMYGRVARTGQQGMLPANYVEAI